MFFCNHPTHIGPDFPLPYHMTKIIPTTNKSVFLTRSDFQEVKFRIKTLQYKKTGISDAISEPLAVLITNL